MSEKAKEAEAMLPGPLQAVYQQLVEEYKFLTELYYGRGYVAYKVLAELVLAGWRPSAEADPASKLDRRQE